MMCVFSLVFVTGCRDDMTPPPTGPEDRTLTDYNFMDISDNCKMYKDVNMSTEESPCNETRDELTMFYDEEYNWTIMCCEFDVSCTENMNSNASKMCPNANDGNYTGYVYNDQGFWLAQCCDETGGNCYVDTHIDVDNESTVCDEKYHNNLYSPENNGSMWESICCTGGIEE